MSGMTKNPVTEAAKICGSLAELARRIGVTKAAVWQWENQTKVPAERCIEIERTTNGAVRCEDLRPDVDWAYLRGPGAVNPESTPNPEITETLHECASGDPRFHTERRQEEKRQCIKRRKEAA